MSYSVDANILIYASNRSSAKHDAATKFLGERAKDTALFCLAWPVVMAYLRISTHPRIFDHPLSPGEALNNIKALLSLPQVRVLTELDGFLQTYSNVTNAFPVRGNLVPDAHLAGILLENDVGTLYTTDSDFKKFDFLDVRNPFT